MFTSVQNVASLKFRFKIVLFREILTLLDMKDVTCDTLLFLAKVFESQQCRIQIQ